MVRARLFFRSCAGPRNRRVAFAIVDLTLAVLVVLRPFLCCFGARYFFATVTSMLRSNAPCLSNSYSSFSRHLTLRKCYSSVNAVPVGSAEFLGVLKSLWPKVEARQGANETNYVVGMGIIGDD